MIASLNILNRAAIVCSSALELLEKQRSQNFLVGRVNVKN